MRYVIGVMVAGGLLWLGVMVTQYINDKEALGELRLLNAIQEESLAICKQQTERTDSVLQQREEQRSMQDVARQKAVRQLYEAEGGPQKKGHPKNDDPKKREGQWDLDRPLPDTLIVPLLLQYQTLTASGPSCESTPPGNAVARAPSPRAAGSAHHQKSGLVDQ